MGRDRVTFCAIQNGELAEFLRMVGLEEFVKKDSFTCAGCGKTLTIDEVSYVEVVKPKPRVYGAECAKVINDLDEAETEMWKAWIEEKKEQQEGKPWPEWMLSKKEREK